jgi:hypothetical protein
MTNKKMPTENNTPKTFAEFGLSFEEDTECVTCNNGSCHNNVTSRKDGKEYNVHISVNYDTNEYWISASENSSSESSNDIYESFPTEEEAVKFVCANFDWFKCF